MKPDIHRILKQDLDDLPNDVGTLKELLKEAVRTIQVLRERIQQLEDEIAELKGEKKRASYKESKKPLAEPSERRGTGATAWAKGSKKEKAIPVDERVVLEVEATNCRRCGQRLEVKSYEKVVIQDLRIERHNTEYQIQEKRCPNPVCTYQARACLPERIQGHQFGEQLRYLVPYLYYRLRMTQPQIEELLSDLGLVISAGQINVLIQAGGAACADVADDLLTYHLWNLKPLHIDDTRWRTRGQNKQMYVVCNREFSYYRVLERRNSAAVKELLAVGPWDEVDEDKVYFVYLVTDDHSSFSPTKLPVLGRGLCWVHELRHYKKLIPVTKAEREEGEKVLGQLYDLLDRIQGYREHPTAKEAQAIEKQFVKILSQPVQWLALAERMQRTLAKQAALLLGLKYPEMEPTNNQAERDLRQIVCRRKISGGTRSAEGEQHLTSALSVIETCRKQGRNVLEFFKQLVLGMASPEELCTPLVPDG